MLRDSVATESIYGFAPEQANEQTKEPIFVLSSSQLQDIIKEANQQLQDRVESLEATVISLEAKVSALGATQDTQADNELNMLRLINNLRESKTRKLTKTQEGRSKILRSLLAAHEGKMLAKEAYQIMRMDKSNFYKLLDSMGDYIISKPSSLDRRQTILVLKSWLTTNHD